MLSCCLVFAPPLIAETKLDIPQARQLAAQYVATGQIDMAIGLTTVLLQRDPTDIEALILSAHAHRIKGDFAVAKTNARYAYSLADTDTQSFAAAVVMAQALSSNGQKTAAQLWLRRAADYAPDDNSKARVIRDFRYVKDQNPWLFTAHGGIRPSNNINNGSQDNTYMWGGIVFTDPSLQPLSGLELSGGFSLFRRMNSGLRPRLSFGLTTETRRYILSEDAKAINPSARASDFAYDKIEAHAIMNWKGHAGQPSYLVRLTAGHNRYGGTTLSNYVRGAGSVRLQPNRNNAYTFSTSVEKQWRQDNDLRSAEIFELGTAWTHITKGGNRLDFTIRGSDTRSDSSAIAHDRLRLGIFLSPNKKIIGAVPRLHLQFEERWYDQAREISVPRRDNQFSVGAALLFSDYQVWGFAPEVGLSIRQNNSNVSRYETREYGLDFTIRSVF